MTVVEGSRNGDYLGVCYEEPPVIYYNIFAVHSLGMFSESEKLTQKETDNFLGADKYLGYLNMKTFLATNRKE